MKTPAMRIATARVVVNVTCEALVQRSDEDIKDWCENFCLGNLFECPIDICRCTAMVLDEDFYWSKHWSLDLPNTGHQLQKTKDLLTREYADLLEAQILVLTWTRTCIAR